MNISWRCIAWIILVVLNAHDHNNITNNFHRLKERLSGARAHTQQRRYEDGFWCEIFDKMFKNSDSSIFSSWIFFHFTMVQWHIIGACVQNINTSFSVIFIYIEIRFCGYLTLFNLVFSIKINFFMRTNNEWNETGSIVVFIIFIVIKRNYDLAIFFSECFAYFLLLINLYWKIYLFVIILNSINNIIRSIQF